MKKIATILLIAIISVAAIFIGTACNDNYSSSSSSSSVNEAETSSDISSNDESSSSSDINSSSEDSTANSDNTDDSTTDNTTDSTTDNTTDNTETDENLYGLEFYLLSDGTYTVKVGGGAYLSEIIIPESYNDIPVTRIAAYGFSAMENLTTITIPSSVTYIGDYAFAYSEQLETVYVEDESNCYSVNNLLYAGSSQIQTGKYSFIDTAVMYVYMDDSSDNNTQIDVYVSGYNSTIKTVNITAALNTTTDIEFESSITLNNHSTVTTADFGTYGLFKDIVVEFCSSSGTVVKKISTSGVTVTADEYNIAHLNGTYGPLVFSLKLYDITENGSIPTFVSLERGTSYNWDNLPYNMQCFSMLTYEKATAYGQFHNVRSEIAEYIEELYTLNNSSHFTLYIVDNYTELFLQYFVANNIPESNYDVVLLSDGTGTASILSSTFGAESVTSLTETYNAMKANYEEIKQYVWDTGSYDTSVVYNMVEYKYSIDEILTRYPYIVVNEESNVSWWVNRLREGENLTAIAAKTGGSGFISAIRSVTTEYYTNNLLAALTEEQSSAFKALYKFDEDTFSAAEESNTEVMVILGTAWSSETNIYDYIKMTIDYYGSGYTYYYKPHPGYPTSSYSARQEVFDKLEAEGYTIIELEASIAAEIFIYYFPDIYISGWQSTTFYSVDTSQALVVYDITKSAAESSSSVATYYSYLDMFITATTADTVQTNYGITLTSGDNYKYYIVEYNDSTEAQQTEYNKHQIAIYCFDSSGESETLTISYYKGTGSETVTWSQVNADGSAISAGTE